MSLYRGLCNAEVNVTTTIQQVFSPPANWWLHTQRHTEMALWSCLYCQQWLHPWNAESKEMKWSELSMDNKCNPKDLLRVTMVLFWRLWRMIWSSPYSHFCRLCEILSRPNGVSFRFFFFFFLLRKMIVSVLDIVCSGCGATLGCSWCKFSPTRTELTTGYCDTNCFCFGLVQGQKDPKRDCTIRTTGKQNLFSSFFSCCWRRIERLTIERFPLVHPAFAQFTAKIRCSKTNYCTWIQIFHM